MPHPEQRAYGNPMTLRRFEILEEPQIGHSASGGTAGAYPREDVRNA
jgi:hypothetical protein